ncbi:protein phosphatase 2C domain-containing protein [Sphingomonas sp. GB1N7]|uniref:protein phosphatase 2C domain-containing protein n=1 Tax=Parasphingomonas caseinilytica TaxID=3096158 RepID=UPI002FC9DCF8
MHFDLIQTLSVAGDPATPNDDRCGSTARLAWMIDGATDLGEAGLMGAQGGAAWLSDAAARAFASADAAPLGTIVAEVFARLASLYRAERAREPLGAWEHPSAAFLAVAIEGAALHLAWLADCACLLIRDGDVIRLGPQPTMAETEQVRALAGPRDAVAAGLRHHRARPERRVLGIDPAHADDVHHASATIGAGDEIVLMTDGMAALFDDYDMPLAAFVSHLRDDGLPELAVRLRAIERDDAVCLRYPRFKRSDDATALWLRVAG